VAAFALIFGPQISDVGKVVLTGDIPVGVFSRVLGVVSRKPFLGCDGWWLSWLVRLTGRQFGCRPFGGGPGFRRVGIPGRTRFVGFG
jgi:hypothetical protein